MTEVHKLVKSEVPTARHKTLTSFSRKRLRYRNFQVIANENKNKEILAGNYLLQDFLLLWETSARRIQP